MTKLARFLAGLAIFGFFVIAAGRAADAEFASAGGVLEERGEVSRGGADPDGVLAAVVVPGTPRSSSAARTGSVLTEREENAAVASPRRGVAAGERNWRGNSARPSRSVSASSSAGGVLEERGESVTAGQVDTRQVAATPRSSSACGASSIGPDGRVTVTVCGEGLSERVAEVGRQSTTPRGGSWPRQTAIDATRSESLYQGKQESIRAIRRVFGRRAPAAIRVAGCETGGTFYARAVSRTGDYGLFQANYRAHHWRGESTAAFARRHFNLAYHVPWAYKLSRGGTNWGPWACRWAA